MVERYKKYYWACGISLLILSTCLFLLFQLHKTSAINNSNIPTETFILFFVSVGFIYVIATVLWRYFYFLFGRQRRKREAFLDMGLMAIGKYLPGKIWGIALRGSFDEDRLELNRGRIFVSALEQAFSLIMGVLIVGSLTLATTWRFSWVSGIAYVTVAIFVVLMILPALKMILKRLKSIHTDVTLPSAGCRLLLGAGYGLLWIASAAPLLILMHSSLDLPVPALVSITVAFLGSMIAGWLALFAPGGIGVRESVFVLLAPDFLSWDEGLYWITLHRGLFILFDVFYGLSALILIAARARLLALR